MPCAYRWVALSDTDRVTGLSRNLRSMRFLVLSMPPFDARGVTLVLSIDDDSVVMRLQNRLDGVGNLYGEPFEGLQAFCICLYYPRQFADAIES